MQMFYVAQTRRDCTDNIPLKLDFVRVSYYVILKLAFSLPEMLDFNVTCS